MVISPRKTEVDPVVELLESSDFDSSAQMASAIIKLVAHNLSLRDAFGVAVGFAGDGQPGFAVGAFYTLRDAKNMAQEARKAGLEARVCRLSGTGSVKTDQGLKRACMTCGHNKEIHAMGVCCVAKCVCTSWAEMK